MSNSLSLHPWYFPGNNPGVVFHFLLPSQGDLPNWGMELSVLALAGEFFTTEPPGKPSLLINPFPSPFPFDNHIFALRACESVSVLLYVSRLLEKIMVLKKKKEKMKKLFVFLEKSVSSDYLYHDVMITFIMILFSHQVKRKIRVGITYSVITANLLGNEASKTTSYQDHYVQLTGNETRYSLRVTTLNCKT